MSGFEGSFLGAEDKISAQAVMECKICWTPYDPAEGDDYFRSRPGHPFWPCPTIGPAQIAAHRKSSSWCWTTPVLNISPKPPAWMR